jgi:hypothetical protein
MTNKENVQFYPVFQVVLKKRNLDAAHAQQRNLPIPLMNSGFELQSFVFLVFH